MSAAQQILQAYVNTTVAITAALPNIALAEIVGVITTANYAKMEDGGLPNGEDIHKDV